MLPALATLPAPPWPDGCRVALRKKTGVPRPHGAHPERRPCGRPRHAWCGSGHALRVLGSFAQRKRQHRAALRIISHVVRSEVRGRVGCAGVVQRCRAIATPRAPFGSACFVSRPPPARSATLGAASITNQADS
ncbi:hypothetical protein CBM2615_B30018 [Cupriavidus taiwanensis]|nr:hypothetical protein CBM2615_B30018 [Cupriavidus taiwanensis]SPA09526.1 hypothetical protein CBM2625_B20049 [Cupriavidus taiwanensis]